MTKLLVPAFSSNVPPSVGTSWTLTLTWMMSCLASLLGMSFSLTPPSSLSVSHMMNPIVSHGKLLPQNCWRCNADFFRGPEQWRLIGDNSYIDTATSQNAISLQSHPTTFPNDDTNVLSYATHQTQVLFPFVLVHQKIYSNALELLHYQWSAQTLATSIDDHKLPYIARIRNQTNISNPNNAFLPNNCILFVHCVLREYHPWRWADALIWHQLQDGGRARSHFGCRVPSYPNVFLIRVRNWYSRAWIDVDRILWDPSKCRVLFFMGRAHDRSPLLSCLTAMIKWDHNLSVR